MKRLIIAALLVCAATARAHGGLPVSQRILRQSDGDVMFVPVVFWGLWVGKAGGPWRWICEEMVNQYRYRKWALSKDGTFYTTDQKGLDVSTDRGCTFTAAPGALAALHLTDVFADPADGATAYATSGDGGSLSDDGGLLPAKNGVFVTHDHGASWTTLPGLATTLLYESVRVSQNDPKTLYLSASNATPPFNPTLFTSSDAGQTFTAAPLANKVDGVAPYALELLAIDPRNAGVVWGRAIAIITTATDSVTRHALLRSADGGRSFVEVAKLDAATEPSGQTRGIDDVAFDVPNKLVYVATRTGVLSGSDDGSSATPSLASLGSLRQSQCVDVHGGALYACSSQYQPDSAALARSNDNGRTFSSVLNYVDTVGPVDYCPAGTPVGDSCPFYWYMYASQLGITFDGGAGADFAGTPQKNRGGCGCDVGARRGVGAGALAGTLAALGLLLVAMRARLS